MVHDDVGVTKHKGLRQLLQCGLSLPLLWLTEQIAVAVTFYGLKPQRTVHIMLFTDAVDNRNYTSGAAMSWMVSVWSRQT